MLTRRGFAGFASCALCAVTGFIATDASAQGAAPVATTRYTRKILSQVDGPTPGYVTILVEAELQPGGTIARHTSPTNPMTCCPPFPHEAFNAYRRSAR